MQMLHALHSRYAKHNRQKSIADPQNKTGACTGPGIYLQLPEVNRACLLITEQRQERQEHSALLGLAHNHQGQQVLLLALVLVQRLVLQPVLPQPVLPQQLAQLLRFWSKLPGLPEQQWLTRS
ncbi:hypothetical protein [Pseudomethylobacillus aquaticus]|uniref:hypothetical protein n=1 Tax=Pseudomethylobacillus aquaticus TaxID=2676064 RepID=UPI0013900595|nr:hypothetical protein [Pseudomethylobacillus aquaticus]